MKSRLGQKRVSNVNDMSDAGGNKFEDEGDSRL